MARSNERYNVYCNGRKIYSELTEEEYFDVMEDLAQEYYKNGTPAASELHTEIILINGD